MKENNRKKKTIVTVLLIVVAVIIIGFAALSSNLNIFGGISVIGKNDWKIIWDEDSIEVNSDSTAEVTTAPTIDSDNSAKLDFVVKLNKPGDFYEFTVDAYNAGTIDAMIDTNGVNSIIYLADDDQHTPVTPDFLNYTVSYADDEPLGDYHLLKSKAKQTYKVRIEFDRNLDNEDLPDTVQAYTYEFSVNYIQADDRAINISPALGVGDEVCLNASNCFNVVSSDASTTKLLAKNLISLNTLSQDDTISGYNDGGMVVSSNGDYDTLVGLVADYVDQELDGLDVTNYGLISVSDISNLGTCTLNDSTHEYACTGLPSFITSLSYYTNDNVMINSDYYQYAMDDNTGNIVSFNDGYATSYGVRPYIVVSTALATEHRS